MFVYVIVNDVNLKIYVGKTTLSNLQQYLQQKFYEAGKLLGGRSHLYAAIRKHGREHFHIYPLFEGVTNEEICKHEKLLIKTLNSRNPDVGYNICRGGEGFTGPHTEEWKRKARERMLGNKYSLGYHPSEATRQKIGAVHIGNKYALGKHPSMETRAKISEALKGKNKGKAPWSAGKKMPPEFGAKISASLKGHPISPETRVKIAAAARNRIVSEETRRRMGIAIAESIKKNPHKHNKFDKQFAVQAAARGHHNRWHVNRGIVNPDCKLCGKGE